MRCRYLEKFQVPSSKFQVPMKFQLSNAKAECSPEGLVPDWNSEFVWNLELGAYLKLGT